MTDPTFSFACGPWQQLPSWELTGARSRSVTFRLGPQANHEASFDVDASHVDSTKLRALIDDVWLLWDGAPIYRGRVGGDRRTWSGDRQSRSVATADYRAVLARRELYDLNTRSWSAVDGAIAWAMVQQTQGNSGGNLGIVQGVGTSTGVTRAYDAEPGSFVADNIDTLAQMADGFDWDVTPVAGSTALHLDIWHGGRGTDRDLVLEHGSNAVATGRDTDTSAYANAGRWSGGAPDGGTEPVPVVWQASDITTRPEGRWDTQEGDPEKTSAATLSAYAAGRQAKLQAITPSWTFKLARKVGDEMVSRNVWEGPEQLWLGDPVTWVCQDGDLNVVETLRLVELSVTFSDTGSVEVEGTLGAPSPASRRRVRQVDQRLTALERR